MTFRDIIDANYNWILSDAENAFKLLGLATRHLSLGQFEVARLAMLRVATTAGDEGEAALIRLLLDVVENGPPNDWLVSSSIGSSAQLRWRCLIELQSMKAGDRVPLPVRKRLEYELLLEVAFRRLVDAGDSTNATVAAEECANAAREMLERYNVAMTLASTNTSTPPRTGSSSGTTSANVAQTHADTDSAPTSPRSSVATTTTTTTATSVTHQAPNNTSAAASSTRRISTLGSIFSLGRRKADDSSTQPSSTAAPTVSTVAALVTSAPSVTATSTPVVVERVKLPTLSARTVARLRDLMRTLPVMFRCLFDVSYETQKSVISI
jgi:hypothetical protein